MISTLFLNKELRKSLYFFERDASFTKGWERLNLTDLSGTRVYEKAARLLYVPPCQIGGLVFWSLLCQCLTNKGLVVRTNHGTPINQTIKYNCC